MDYEKAVRSAFPYPPYDIQVQFMLNVIENLDNKQIGLFESPTGTGKTLSVICSTLHWLEVERERQQQQAAAEAAAQDAAVGLPEWLAAAHAASTFPQAAQQNPQHKERVARKAKVQGPPVLDDEGNDVSEFLPDRAAADAASPGAKRAAPDTGSYSSSSSGSEDESAAADAAAGEAAAAPAPVERRRPQVIFCSRTHSQLSQFVGELHRTRFGSSTLLVSVASRKALCVNDEVRWLSELSQINERCLDLQRSKASSSSSSKRTLQAAPASSTVVGLTGGQRPQQRRRQRSSGGRKPAGCPYLSVEGGAAGWDDFRDLVLSAPMDVEELASLGSKMKVCPYYGSRRAVPGADVVLAPYSSVLQPDARESLGIELQDSVLVFDEAHNLLDAINSAHSTSVTAWQLLSVQRSLTAYYDRFKGVLSPSNAHNIQSLLHIAAALHSCLQQGQQQQGQQQPAGAPTTPPSSSSSGSSRVTTVNDLLFDLGLDTINMFELAAWVRDNKMAFKVSGYTAAAVAKAGGSIDLQKQPVLAAAAVSSSQQQAASASLGQLSARDGVSAIHAFVSFLLSLTHADADGRIIVQPPQPTTPPHTTAATAAVAAASTSAAGAADSRGDQASRGGQLRYVLLNAARHFGKLLASARSVLLVSGTLAPVEGLAAQLFPDAGPGRVRHFECGHVVPPQQLLALAVGRGPSGRALDLRHEARGEGCVKAELGQLLVNLCGVVPAGLVVFVPSFSYLEQLSQAWRESGVWDRLAQRKKVFSEPRAATDVEAVLAAYAAAIEGHPAASSTQPQQPAAAEVAPTQHPAGSASSSSSRGGALMLCVVGGKLSEGINFGDGLGRCVVVVGLPYPNRTDVELQARMQYLDRMAAAAAGTGPDMPPPAAAAAAAGSLAAPQQHATPQQSSPSQQQQQDSASVQPVARRSAFQVINQAATRHPHPAAAAPAGTTKQPQPSTAPSPTSPAAEAAAAVSPALEAPGVGPGGSTSPATAAAAVPPGSRGPGRVLLSGRAYYEDLCFKAVNQCVGRVVRHKGDYAAVVLLDTRWVAGPAEWAAASSGSSRRKLPVQKLPGWLQRSYVPTNGDFGPALQQLAAFFRRQQQPAAATMQ